MTRHDDSVRWRHRLDYALAVRRMASGRTRPDLDRDEMFRLALTRAIEVIGEAAAKVSAAGRAEHPDLPWSQMAAVRNRLIHGYDMVDHDILWRIVTEDIPALIAKLEAMS